MRVKVVCIFLICAITFFLTKICAITWDDDKSLKIF